jgi:recombination protein RecA
MSQALRKLSGIINRSNTTAIFINQLREKIGVMFGNPEVTPGGKALKFYATMRLEVRRGTQTKQGVDISGHKTNVKIVKNKVAPPFKVVELDIVFGEGVSKMSEIIDLATGLDLIDKAGSWYSYNDQKIGQGKDVVKDYLKANPDIADLLEKQIKEHYFAK